MFEAHQPGLVGKTTGAIEPAGGVAFAEVQQAQTDAVRLFRMGAALELPAHPRVHRRSHLPGPAQQALGGPLVLCPMACGHVGRVSGEPGPVLARVGGDPLLPEVEFDQRFTGVQVQLLAHILVRHRVIMVPILDMVVDIDRDRFDGDVAVGVPG